MSTGRNRVPAFGSTDLPEDDIDSPSRGLSEMILRRTIAWAGLAALPLFCLPAHAGTPSVALTGEYDFYTFAQKDNRPVCAEHYTFGADGTLTIRSGQEIVTAKFRFEDEADHGWLISTGVATNGLPDCMGHSQANPPPGEGRMYVYWAADGGLVTCETPSFIAGSTKPILRCDGHLMRSAH